MQQLNRRAVFSHLISSSSCCCLWLWVLCFQSSACTQPDIWGLRILYPLSTLVTFPASKNRTISSDGSDLLLIWCTAWLMKSYFGGHLLFLSWRSTRLREFLRLPSCSWQKDLCLYLRFGISFLKGMRGFTQSISIHCLLTMLIFPLHRCSTEDRSLARYLHSRLCCCSWCYKNSIWKMKFSCCLLVVSMIDYRILIIKM